MSTSHSRKSTLPINEGGEWNPSSHTRYFRGQYHLSNTCRMRIRTATDRRNRKFLEIESLDNQINWDENIIHQGYKYVGEGRVPLSHAEELQHLQFYRRSCMKRKEELLSQIADIDKHIAELTEQLRRFEQHDDRTDMIRRMQQLGLGHVRLGKPSQEGEEVNNDAGYGTASGEQSPLELRSRRSSGTGQKSVSSFPYYP